MTRTLRRLLEVADDVDEVMDYLLAADAAPAAHRFNVAAQRAQALVHKTPERWPQYLHGTRKHFLAGLRGNSRNRFAVIYTFTDTEVVVHAVADLRREAGYWRGRK